MTDKQRQARLENLKKARGPNTPDGKARSAQNATKHGYWARSLSAIDHGPLREDPDELIQFHEAYVAELKPGGKLILRQAALDVADKAWRLTRAQRWEAEGYSGADYGTPDAAIAAELRSGASRHRRQAETVRQFPDPAVSYDDLEWALCTLSFAVGMSEEDLDWIEEAEPPALVEALASLISEHFDNQEEAASSLDARAAQQEAEAREVEDMWRPDIIRREMDTPFARNAERLVSHASRELDRALRRYDILVDRFGDADDDQAGDGEGQEPDSGAVPPDDGDQPKPAGAADKPDIWSYMTADEVVDYLSKLRTSSPSDPPPRNEPTDRSAAM